jgi:hypothetical protein
VVFKRGRAPIENEKRYVGVGSPRNSRRINIYIYIYIYKCVSHTSDVKYPTATLDYHHHHHPRRRRNIESFRCVSSSANLHFWAPSRSPFFKSCMSLRNCASDGNGKLTGSSTNTGSCAISQITCVFPCSSSNANCVNHEPVARA